MTEQAIQIVADVSREILNPLINLLFAAALVYFIYGVVQFIAKADNEQARKKGKRHLVYSILGLVIMAGVWGIVQLLINTLGVNPPAPSEFEQLSLLVGYY